MNRFILTMFLSLSVLFADSCLASEQPGVQITCDAPEISAALENIEDIQKRELIWNYALKICGNQMQNSSAHIAVINTLSSLDDESLEKTANDILQLTEHPDLRDRPDCPDIFRKILVKFESGPSVVCHDELNRRLNAAPIVIEYIKKNNLDLAGLSSVVNSVSMPAIARKEHAVELLLYTCEAIAKDRKWSAAEHACIILALTSQSEEELKALPHAINQILEGYDSGYRNNNHLICDIIRYAPIERITEILTKTVAFAQQNNIPPVSVSGLFKGFSKLTPENEEETLRLATVFMREAQCDYTKYNFSYYFDNFISGALDTGALNGISETKIQAVIEYVKQCGFELGEASSLIRSVARIPDANVDGLLKAARLICMKQNWQIYDHANFIGSCASLPIDRAEMVFDAICSIVGGDSMRPHEYGEMCGTLGLVPYEQLEHTLTSLKTLVLEQKLSTRVVRGILSASWSDPKERIPYATKFARSMIDKGLIEEYDLTTLMGYMIEISTDRLAILCDALPEYCVSDELHGNDIHGFIYPLQEVPAARMTLAFKKAALLAAGKNWEPAHHVKMIEALGEVHPDHMDTILDAYASIVEGKNWDGKAHAKIISALANVPVEQIAYLLKTLALITKDKEWTGKDHATLLITLALAPSNHMTEALDKLENVTQVYDCDAKVQTFIIQTLCNTNPEEWDHMLNILKPIISYKDAENPLDLRGISYLIKLFPESESVRFIESCINAFEENPEPFYDENEDDDAFDPIITNFIASIDSRDNDDKQQLLDYWKDMMVGENPLLARIVCGFIEDQGLAMGFVEEDEIVQMAMRVMTVLEDGDERGAHVIYEKLKAKRTVPIEWGKLKVIQGCIDGLNVRLNPVKIANLGASMKLELSSVPKLNAKNFIDLLNQLQIRLKSNEDLLRDASHIMDQTKSEHGGEAPDDFSEDEDEEPLPQMQEVESQSDEDVSTDEQQEALPKNSRLLLKLIENACNLSSHFCHLMNAAPKSLEGSRMKCVISHFMSLPDENNKWIRICQFLSGVRACAGGMNTAIQDYYMCLTPVYKLRSLSGFLEYDFHEMPAITALLNAMQSVVSMQFSPESMFMKEVCGVFPGQNLDQAAHQIIWVKGLIGDRVGLTEGPRFDINAGTINQLILTKSQQEIIELYYNRLELKHIIPLMKTAFDRLMVDDKSIYNALMVMCDKVKTPEGKEDFQSWIVTRYDDENDIIGETVITERGMVQVMTKVGMLDPILDPLGWGN